MWGAGDTRGQNWLVSGKETKIEGWQAIKTRNKYARLVIKYKSYTLVNVCI